MAAASSTTFGRWGTPPHPVELSYAAEEFLGTTLGTPRPRPPHSQADVVVPPGRLTGDQLAALGGLVSPNGVSTAAGDRLGHSAGCSLTDYLTLRSATPDAVTTSRGSQPTIHSASRTGHSSGKTADAGPSRRCT